MQTARIVTDVGHAYIKAMGPHESPHLLAIELIVTRLAQWFKLPVLDFAVIQIDAEIDEIPLKGSSFAHSGPAFVTRAIDAHQWGGSSDELNKLVNTQDIGRLVVFDTWVRNCDRYSSNLTGTRANKLFGLFPGFVARVRQTSVESAIADLRTVDVEVVQEIVREIPDEWQVSHLANQSLTDFLVRRSRFVADSVHSLIAAECWPGKFFDS